MRLSAFLAITLSGAMLVVACAQIKDPTKDWTPERFYNEARTAMEEEDYERAIKHFETMEARYPYGRYAQQAQLEIAYAYYKADEPTLAKEAAERFIRLYPTHPHVAYAYYLKGLVNVREEKGLMRWLGLEAGESADRDPKAAQEAYEAFREVVERFPDSQYARDAEKRMAYLQNTLAQHEVQVAQFYLDQEAYVAAVNRAKYVIENYQRTPAVEDALAIQVQAYRLMGLTKLMEDALRVLNMNFPNSHYMEEINPTESKTKKRNKKKARKKNKTEEASVNY